MRNKRPINAQVRERADKNLRGWQVFHALLEARAQHTENRYGEGKWAIIH